MSDAILLRGGGEKPIYMWKKYEVNTSTTYTWDKWNAVNETRYIWNRWNYITTWIKVYGIRSTGSVAGGIYCGNGSEYVTFYRTASASESGIALGSAVSLKGPDVTSGLYSPKSSSISPVTRTVSGGYYTSGRWWSTGECVESYDTGTSTPEYNRGSTKYSDSESTNPNAYPSNGVSGSYWYVSAGSRSVTIKGNTSYGTVSSSSSSAYPDNGVSGSYWYNNKQTVINHSMGNYIEDVFSLAQDTYPTNGIAGSYWYVYQGQI